VPDPGPHAAAPRASTAFVYVLSFVLAACSLLYELLIAQTLTMIAGNMVTWYSLTIGAYLAAMGLGSILHGTWSRRRPSDWSRLFTIELWLTLAGTLVVPALQLAHALYFTLEVRGAAAAGAIGFYAVWFAVTFGVGLLTGMELPVLIDLGNQASSGRSVTNRVLGWDYIGALAGGIVFPLLLVPNLELHLIGFVIAPVNLVAACFILRRAPRDFPGRGRRLAGASTLAALLVAGVAFGGHIEQYFLKRYYFFPEVALNPLQTVLDPLGALPDVQRANSPYQKIDIVRYPGPRPHDVFIDAYSDKFVENPDFPRDWFLFLNGDNQFTSNYEELYHEWFAHVPIVANGKVPQRVLVLGGGDGILHRELLKYDEIEHILHVDLDAYLVNLARHDPFLAGVNLGSLDDPRVTTIFRDAYAYMRTEATRVFDAIYMDFPTVRDYNLSRLYTREFFHFVVEHLADDGFAVMDTPELALVEAVDADGKPDPWLAGTWRVHRHTMRTAGFRSVIPFFTLLDPDNPRAIEALENSQFLARAVARADGALDSPEAQREWLESRVRWYTSNQKQGFIMMRKDGRRGPFAWNDPGIDTHMLNRKRFRLAFPVQPEPFAGVDPAMVNSILRPRLPESAVGEIRMAW